jgi:hypothetical protein
LFILEGAPERPVTPPVEPVTETYITYIDVTAGSEEIQVRNADGSMPVFPVVGAARAELALINTAFTSGAKIALNLNVQDGKVVGFNNVVATVSDATEFNNAVAINAIELIKLDSSFTGTPANITKLVDIDFGSYTMTGNLTVNTTEKGTMTLSGTATNSIVGNLTVTAANATVNNNINVNGTVQIDAIAVNTWNQNGKATTLTWNAPAVNGKAATLNLGSKAEVTTANFAAPAAVTGADKIVTANVTADGVKLDKAPAVVTGTKDVEIGGTTKTAEEIAKEAAAAAVKLNSAKLNFTGGSAVTTIDGKSVTFTLNAQAPEVVLTGITADFAGLKDGTYEINLMKVESADAIADAGFKAALEAAGFVINGDVATHAEGQKFGDLVVSSGSSTVDNLPSDQTFQTKGTWTLKVEVKDAADQAHTFTILIVVK